MTTPGVILSAGDEYVSRGATPLFGCPAAYGVRSMCYFGVLLMFVSMIVYFRFFVLVGFGLHFATCML